MCPSRHGEEMLCHGQVTSGPVLVVGSLWELGQLEGHRGAWAQAKGDRGCVYPQTELPSAHEDGQRLCRGVQGADPLSGAYQEEA